MRRFLEALGDVIIDFARMGLRIIEKRDEFLVEIFVVLAVYFGVARILFAYGKADQAIGWLTGGAIMTVLVQAFRNRLGGDPEANKKEPPSVAQ